MSSGLVWGWRRQGASANPIGFAPPRKVDGARRGELVTDTTDGHAMILAPTGAGKSRSIAIPNLLHWNGPAIVLDLKGELAATTAAYRRDTLGQTVAVLDPWKRITASPNRLNPLDILNEPEADTVDLEQQLADMLVDPRDFMKEPFWPERGSNLVAATIDLVNWHPDLRANFGEVWRLLTGAGSSDGLLYVIDPVIDAMPEFARRNITAHFETADTTRKSIESVASGHLRVFASESVRSAVSETDFDLGLLRRGGPITIYICIEPAKLRSHAPLVRLWLSTLLHVILDRRERPELDTLLVLDEVIQLGPMEQIRTVLTLARSYGVRAMMLAQSIGALKQCYPDAQSLIENCATLCTFGHSSHSMSRDTAELFGDISAATLAHLMPDELAIRQAGQQTQVLRKLDSLQDDLFRKRVAANPIFARRRA